jgi:hypothetical protein
MYFDIRIDNETYPAQRQKTSVAEAEVYRKMIVQYNCGHKQGNVLEAMKVIMYRSSFILFHPENYIL